MIRKGTCYRPFPADSISSYTVRFGLVRPVRFGFLVLPDKYENSSLTTYACICMCVYVHIYIYIYTHINTNKHNHNNDNHVIIMI